MDIERSSTIATKNDQCDYGTCQRQPRRIPLSRRWRVSAKLAGLWYLCTVMMSGGKSIT